MAAAIRSSDDKKPHMKMSYDETQKLETLTVAEFDFVRSYMQAQMRALSALTPQKPDEKRCDYIARLRKLLLESGDKPPLIERMCSENRDFVLEKLSDIDGNPAHLDILRSTLVKLANKEISAANGVAHVLQAIDPSQYRQMQRALLQERLKADAERKLNLQ